MRFNKLASAGLVAIVALGANLQPAHADSITDILRGFLNNSTTFNGGTNPGYNQDYSNQPYNPNQQYLPSQQQFYPSYPTPAYNPAPVDEIGSTGANHQAIEANLSAGIETYTKQISAGTASGQITPAEEASLRAEVNRIVNLRNTYAANGYTQVELQDLTNSFQNFSNMLSSMQSNGTSNLSAAGGYLGGTYGNPNPYLGAYSNANLNSNLSTGLNNNFNFNSYDSVVSYRGGLLNRIDQAAARGAITASEAQNLRFEYNQITKQMNRRSVNGNYANNGLVRRLRDLDRRLDTLLASRQNRWN